MTFLKGGDLKRIMLLGLALAAVAAFAVDRGYLRFHTPATPTYTFDQDPLLAGVAASLEAAQLLAEQLEHHSDLRLISAGESFARELEGAVHVLELEFQGPAVEALRASTDSLQERLETDRAAVKAALAKTEAGLAEIEADEKRRTARLLADLQASATEDNN